MRWAPLSVLLLVAPLAACGGGGGADADALCERTTINGLEDQLSDDGLDFAQLRDSLEVVRAAADGDLDRETDNLIEVSDQFEEALEDVDLDDEDEVDDALDPVNEDLDDDIFEDVQEVLVFVDQECDTELAQGGQDEEPGDDEDEPVDEDPVDLALEELCADDTIDSIRVVFDGGAFNRDFDAERDALDVAAEAADGDLDEQVDLLQDAVDVMEDVGEGADSAAEATEALGEAFLEEFGAEGLEEVTAAGDDLTQFVDRECGTDLSEGEAEGGAVTTAPADEDDSSLEEFADLVESCEDGDMADCDELFFADPVGSEAEEVGRTCGGRGDETTAGQCEDLFG
jgi:hypothetical protein